MSTTAMYVRKGRQVQGRRDSQSWGHRAGTEASLSSEGHSQKTSERKGCSELTFLFIKKLNAQIITQFSEF